MRLLSALLVPLAMILFAVGVVDAVFDNPIARVGIVLLTAALAGAIYSFISARSLQASKA